MESLPKIFMLHGDQLTDEISALLILQCAHADSFWGYFSVPVEYNKNRNTMEKAGSMHYFLPLM